MVKAVPPSMLEDQIDRAGKIVRSTLRKHHKEIASDGAQKALKGFGEWFLEAFKRRVELLSTIIVLKTKINRNLTPEEMLNATGRIQYVTANVVKSMPKGDGENVEVVFFKLERYMADNELEKEYALRGLVAIDPYSLATVNIDDPEFADKYPNCTHWKNADRKWCYIAFDRWLGVGRSVYVSQGDLEWYDGWWFAGRRK